MCGILTLDDDVAAKLKAETRRSGRSLKETVNGPGLSLDDVADMIERTEGPRHR